MEQETKRKVLRHCGWIGFAAVGFYFLHIAVGHILYEGYDPVRQAISDLTAVGAPSEVAARVLSGVYGLLEVLFRVAFFLYFRKKINKVFDAGAIVFIIMSAVSAVGYAAFPLSAAGSAGGFQDAMHIATTAAVVVSSITALVLAAIGFFKSKNKVMGCAVTGVLVLMMAGSILMGAVPAILGIGERITIYSLQIFTVLLSVFMVRYKWQ